jgi:hypothetical protein
MKNVWLGVLIALLAVLVLLYLSSASVQKLRAESNLNTIQTG